MKRIILIHLFLLIGISIFAQHENKLIREGNSKFDEKDYENAEVFYKKVLDKEKYDEFRANFNIADALYKQKKYEEAIKMFKELADSQKEKINLQLYIIIWAIVIFNQKR